ncbi:MAG TPA: sugar transferase [Terriglobales bacterium]|nr:sugar transferase [Terriglobales bacterium]
MATSETILSQSPEQQGVPQSRLAAGTRGLGKIVRQPWFKKALFLASDTIAVWLAHKLAEVLALKGIGVPPESLNPSNYYLFYVPLFALVLWLFEGYKEAGLRRPEKELELGVKAISFYFVALVCANFVLFKAQGFSRYLIVAWYGLALLLVLGGRFSIRGLYSALWRRGLARETALLAGPPHRLAGLQRQLAVQRHHRYDVVGVLVEGDSGANSDRDLDGLPCLGRLDEWEQVLERHPVQWVLLSLSANELGHYPRVLEIARNCRERGIAVQVYSDLLSSSEFQYERDEFSGFFRFSSPPRWARPVQIAGKAVFDRLIGVVGSVVTLLLTPLIALVIKLEDRGPLFYRSAYLGQDLHDHYYLKFRTMRVNADEQLAVDPALRTQFQEKFKLQSDPRVTRVGKLLRKYSLDEFPQFFSVLLGKLSFVGPRTIRREEAERYGALLPNLLSVKPGLTGFWQAMGRQTTTYDERVRMDMFYIEHWSIWLDLVIVARTFWEVLLGRGAY